MSRPRPAARWRRIVAAAMVPALLGGCSSAPRNFTPRLAAPPADTTAYQRAQESCREQVAAGKRDKFEHDRGTSAAVGAATAGIGIASVGGGGGTLVGAAAVGTAAAASLFILAPIAIYATSRYIRSGKEDEIKQATSTCLAQAGYTVDDWDLVPEQ